MRAVLEEIHAWEDGVFPKSDLQVQLIGFIVSCWGPGSTEQEYDAWKCWNRSSRTGCCFMSGVTQLLSTQDFGVATP